MATLLRVVAAGASPSKWHWCTGSSSWTGREIGDIYPVTGAGRFVAVALMVGGVSLLGVVTATLASWIVQRVAEEDTASAAATAAQIEELRDEIRKLTESMTSRPNHAYGEAVSRDRVSED
jgi:voltage-gated potassium channel